VARVIVDNRTGMNDAEAMIWASSIEREGFPPENISGSYIVRQYLAPVGNVSVLVRRNKDSTSYTITHG